MRIRCFSLALAAAVGCGLAWLPAAAEAQTCQGIRQPMCSAAPTSTPGGMPLKVSRMGHYFDPRGTQTIPLLGQSYEYLCHVCQPTRDPTYCTLTSFPGLFSTMSTNRNNVIRLETIFNHSPGHQPCNAPFADEQPYLRSGSRWDLTQLNPKYFKNLEAVVDAAYNNHIVVEVTLFNPWDGDWTTGPFYSRNTVHRSQGFTDQGFFMTLNNGTGTAAQIQQNMNARAAQQNALTTVVMHLKKYPNVIWEVANEPDFILVPGVTRADVFAWEQSMIGFIIAADHPKGDMSMSRSTHLIQINGHTVDTFAWTQPGPHLPVLAQVETAHYTDINQSKNPGYYGAIQLMQEASDQTIVAGRSSMPIGFNEDIGVPDMQHPVDNPLRADAEVRSEALEFVMHGGALFDGYSQQFKHTGAVNLSKQLHFLADILVPPQGTVGVKWLDAMLPADCNNSGDWCSGITPWNMLDEGDCPGSGANIFWSTMEQPATFRGMTVGDHLLYVHHGKKLGFDFDGYKAIPCVVSTDPAKGYHLTGLQYSVQVPGCYLEYWQDPVTGHPLASTNVNRTDTLLHPSALNPTYAQDALLFVSLLSKASCSTPQPLTSSFSYTCNGLSCSFDGTGSTPIPGITGYSWMWDDGTWTNPSGASQAAYSFPAPGTYVVGLAVSDPSGNVGDGGQQVTVTSSPPIPSFSASCNQLSCTFNGGGSTPGDAPISLYSWTFGDAASADDVTAPPHSYAGGGQYTVTLTVTDGFGVMASTTQTVSAVGPPVAGFSAACTALTCAFDASATTGDSPIVTYAWTFGDGTSGSGVAPPSPTGRAATSRSR